MTTLTTPSPSATAHRDSGGPRLLSWLLRLHRPALWAWTALVLVLGAGLLWLRGPLTDAAAAAWRQYNACDMRPRCAYDQPAILLYKDVEHYITLAVTAVPFLVAAWAGAALFGRELESGTAQLAWAQSLSPTRWLTAKLAFPAVLVTAGTGLLVCLYHLAWSAGRGRIDTARSWYDSLVLHTNGPTTVAFALTGLAAGALAGVLCRRTFPALALALGLTAVVRAVAHLAMPHLWPSVTHTVDRSEGPVVLGLEADSGLVTSTGAHVPVPRCDAMDPGGCSAAYDRLGAVGYYTEYHPFSHYWPLQLTTTALVLVLAGLFALGAFWVLRRTTGTARAAAKAGAV